MGSGPLRRAQLVMQPGRLPISIFVLAICARRRSSFSQFRRELGSQALCLERLAKLDLDVPLTVDRRPARAARSLSLGMAPASMFLSALRMIMNRVALVSL